MSDFRLSMSPALAEIIRRQVQRFSAVLSNEGREFGDMSDAALEVHQALNQLLMAHSNAELLDQFDKEDAAHYFFGGLGLRLMVSVEEVYLQFWAGKDRAKRAAVHMLTHSSCFWTLQPFLKRTRRGR